MKTRELLIRLGVDESIADAVATGINTEIPKEFVKKDVYAKAKTKADDLQEKVNELEVDKNKLDAVKQELATEKANFSSYKENLEIEKTNQSKVDLIKSNIKENGCENPKLIDLLAKTIDLKSVEVKDGKIEGWDKTLEGLKGEYADFFTKTEVDPSGGKPLPTGGKQSTKTYTRDDVSKMSAEEINKIYDEDPTLLENLK